MSVTFAAPMAFAGLAALLVPVVLHLVRRAEHRTTPFAALKFLAAVGLPRRRVRLAELALLLLRCVLLVVLVAWLAQPLLLREPPPRHVVAVVPGVDVARARAAVARIADARGADAPALEARWLAPGFPALDTAPNGREVPVASLLRELDATLGISSRIDVLSPGVVAGLDGERPRLSRAVGFQVVPGPVETPAKETAATSRRIVLRAAADNAVARRYLAAAVAAWNAERAGAASLAEVAADDAPIPAGTHALIWLDAPLSPQAARWIEAGGTALVTGGEDFAARGIGTEDPPTVTPADVAPVGGASAPMSGAVVARDAEGEPVLREQPRGRGRVLTLAVPFEPERFPLLHDGTFPRRLAAWLDTPVAPIDRAVAEALRPERGAPLPALPSEPMAPWLALLAALLAAVERVAASGLRRRALA